VYFYKVKYNAVCAEMIDRDMRSATSDGTSTRIRTLLNDVGHESGIGSDSDVDSTLTPSTPSSHRSTDEPPLSLDSQTSTSGSMKSTELLSADKPEWLHLAEQYASDLPHDVMNVRLDEEYARLVIPPPPLAADSKPEEVDSVHFRLPAEKRPRRCLPAVPSNESGFDEIPGVVPRCQSRPLKAAAADDRKRQNSAELWREAASVNKDHVTPRHSTGQTGNRDDETHASLATSAFPEAQGRAYRQGDKSSTVNSEIVVVSTLPRSRDQRQPISSVAFDSPSLGERYNQQRVEVVKPAHRGAMTSSEEGGHVTRQDTRDTVRDVTDRCDAATLTLETFRPAKRRHDWTQRDHVTDHVTDQQQQQLTSRVSDTWFYLPVSVKCLQVNEIVC